MTTGVTVTALTHFFNDSLIRVGAKEFRFPPSDIQYIRSKDHHHLIRNIETTAIDRVHAQQNLKWMPRPL